MAATNAICLSALFKEKIMNMSDNLDDKEILAYAKSIIKDFKEENKKRKKDVNDIPKKNVKKTKKNIEVDEDGNKKPKTLNKYQQYLKDNQNRIKETYPELTNTQRFSKLAEEWNEYKKTIVNVNVTETTEETTE
jgi:HD superfamily phosphohydrolase